MELKWFLFVTKHRGLCVCVLVCVCVCVLVCVCVCVCVCATSLLCPSGSFSVNSQGIEIIDKTDDD